MEKAKHPTPEALRDYALGLLPDNSHHDVESHLDACPPCQDTLSSLDLRGDTLLHDLERGHAERSHEAGSQTSAAGSGTASDSTDGDVFGAYRLLEKVGAGGMGEVYRAEHTKLGRVVALKLLPSEAAASPERTARFEREMRTVGALHDEHIVQALDAGEIEGRPYLAMELLSGVDLAELVLNDGVMPVAEACDAVRQAARGLQHAHERGIVHRDIKPSNLMLTDPGVVKVLDLGLASVAANQDAPLGDAPLSDAASQTDGPPSDPLTRHGQLLGTPDYMAPEQGLGSGEIDGRTDVYALGATLYYLLTGRSPFPNRAYSTLREKLEAIAQTDAPSIRSRRPDLPASLVPSRRADARQVARGPTALGQGGRLGARPVRRGADLRGLGIDLAPPSAPSGAGKKPPSWRWVAAAGAGAVGIVLALTMTLRTADGTVVIEVPDEVADSLRVTLSNDVGARVADARTGWTLGLREGAWRLELSDPTGDFALDRDEVVVRSGEESLLTVKKRKPPATPTTEAVEPSAAPERVATRSAEPVGFDLPDPLSAEWDLQVDLYAKAYDLNEYGAVMLDGVAGGSKTATSVAAATARWSMNASRSCWLTTPGVSGRRSPR